MEFLKKLGAAKISAIIGAAIIVIAFFIFLVFKMSSAVLTPLYSNLSIEDASMIGMKLQSMGIKYENNTEGTEISVPSDKLLMLRMMFAQEGLPTSGNITGYEIFDRSDALGTSQFVYNVNLVRALEGELVRTISSLNQIENVRVHLVIPKKELFSKIGSEPSASVVLKMKGNQALSKLEVASIANLVATAVPGLKIENITIVDNLGRPLKLGAEDASAANLASTAMEMQLNIENKLKQEIENLLERTIGIGKVKANVAVDMDLDREVISSEIYDPSSQVVRSQKSSEENENDTEPSGVVGVSSNIPNAKQGAAAGASRQRSRTDEIINYEISKTVSNKVIENGRVKALSIAVLVDGNYETDPTTKQMKYSERSQAELDKIKSLIISGVGVNIARGDKVEVINMPFATDFVDAPVKEGMFDFIKNDIQNIVQTVVIGIVLILMVLLVIRPLVLRSLEKAKSVMQEQGLTSDVMASLEQEMKGMAKGLADTKNMAFGNAPNSGGANPTNIDQITMEEQKQRREGVTKRFNELVDKNPEETVSLIKNWIYQE
ncbi:flagellar MS-ring protein [endosymbiont of Acanthamoeba sp. UWC8]|uniref:flagellar basal-body MS-ring/collar protein FliF n=1 Tax=endosymbiont of Acanthamoeba sp. UWC8 TaxID=86106 RepID=UPI0004D199C2|nr:flagellar basal-body MS-ring/collar protein FliF [endosymbiont of Acanthamoeba sp. UWC8]AIF81205.1 flagellar MS-ring protein [endosymbiont of Acanthamoeba sp. UWC8]